jgi:hypothetical protein
MSPPHVTPHHPHLTIHYPTPPHVTPRPPHLTFHYHQTPTHFPLPRPPSTLPQTKSTHRINSGAPPTFRNLTKGGGGSGILNKPHTILNGSDMTTEIHDPGSIPDPPGRSTFNEGGGVRNVVFPPKNHFPQFLPFLSMLPCLLPEENLSKWIRILKIRERFFLSMG